MENSHAPDDSPSLPPETFAPDRWVPCLVEEDEYCLHLACQAMEPLEEDAPAGPVHDDEQRNNSPQGTVINANVYPVD